MSVNPEATGNPSPDADDHLRQANADDPRDDPRAPAGEPGGPQPRTDREQQAGTGTDPQ